MAGRHRLQGQGHSRRVAVGPPPLYGPLPRVAAVTALRPTAKFVADIPRRQLRQHRGSDRAYR